MGKLMRLVELYLMGVHSLITPMDTVWSMGCMLRSDTGLSTGAHTPPYASGVTHYDTYGTGPSSGHINLHTYSRDYKTPLYKTVHYKGHLHHGDSYGHHGAYGHQG